MDAKPEQDVAAAARRRKFDRVRLLNEEMDRLTADVDQRVASVLNKASFLAVAAGVIIAASVAQLWTVLPWIGVLALGFACVGLLCATVALRPGRRVGLVAQRLADLYLDSELYASTIERQLVRQKANIISAREADLIARAQWVAAGSTALLVSVAALTIVFATQTLGG
ncbi:hypothetical protein [Curtobacterium poinsettiae]|uniref:hypothetical protein n=1 Tax=Curtobacterium poinsettiae TaxID=159612 RepID=UPI0023612C99|nr:hypothetical protein [Curtobacterium flaccumfaciens]MDD1386777.1 hypothetical protein [Curtobacterium flaccumfaciens pv. poinsettiae]